MVALRETKKSLAIAQRFYYLITKKIFTWREMKNLTEKLKSKFFKLIYTIGSGPLNAFQKSKNKYQNTGWSDKKHSV